jgi:hypothetical protein
MLQSCPCALPSSIKFLFFSKEKTKPSFTKMECLQEQNFLFSKSPMGFYTPQVTR